MTDELQLRSIARMLMIYRCDLSIALLTGSNPVFHYRPHEPMILHPGPLSPTLDEEMQSQDILELYRNLDADLASTCQTMRQFCAMVTERRQADQLVPPKIVHETMTSAIYPLLHSKFAENIDRAVQLGLLAYSYHLFLQLQDIKLQYKHLSFLTTYQDCICHLLTIDDVSPRLVLWLLMVGAISLFDISDESWLRDYLNEYIDRCQVHTWEEMQDLLDSFMWIAFLDEQPGKDIYHKVREQVG